MEKPKEKKKEMVVIQNLTVTREKQVANNTNYLFNRTENESTLLVCKCRFEKNF